MHLMIVKNRLCFRVRMSIGTALLSLVKGFVLSVWDVRKNELYGSQDGDTQVAGEYS